MERVQGGFMYIWTVPKQDILLRENIILSEGEAASFG